MTRIKNNIILFTFLLVCTLGACYNGSKTIDVSSKSKIDSVLISKGEAAFEKNCASCHNFHQDGIGPQLGGITGKVSVEWLRAFIKDPAGVIASGDAYAVRLHQKYKAMMPSFPMLENEEIDAIIEFLSTKMSLSPQRVSDSGVIVNPFPDPIPLSGIEIDLDSFVQISPSAPSAPLARITKLTYQPGTNVLFVVDLRGKLYRLVNNEPKVYMDMAALKPHFIDKPGLGSGFGSFAFHPEFQKNGLLYTTHTEAPGSATADFKYDDSIKVTLQWVLTEWKVDPKANVFSGKSRELMRVNMVKDVHGVQEITFNPHAKPSDRDYGMLYIGIGDGGCVDAGFSMLVSNPGNIWGKVIRIDPRGNNSRNKQYGIPADNPFVYSMDLSILKETYCYGFRNPHRIIWAKDGQMFTFNIGQGDIESVYLLKAGNNYGWPMREGNFSINLKGDLNKVYALPPDDSVFHITYPVAAYDHDEGKAIAGGYEYKGSIALLKGKIIFGDIPTGKIFYIESGAVKQGTLAPIKQLSIAVKGKPLTLAKACGSERVEVRLGEDAKGELYILTKADGKIYKLSSAKTK